MGPLGSIEFTIVESSNELQIAYGRHAGWIEGILAPALVLPLFVVGWFWQKPGLILAAGGLIVILITRWAWNHASLLRVLPDRLITSVYLWNQTETALSDIQTMQWLRCEMFVEGGDPDGLYISCAGGCKCVLPLVSKEQAKAATDPISRRFPKYPVDVPVSGSRWFEAPPDMTAITLPGPSERDTKVKPSSGCVVANLDTTRKREVSGYECQPHFGPQTLYAG